MIRFLNPRYAVLAIAFVGFSGIGISSYSAQANASLLDECQASSNNKTVACCKHYIERHGRPQWMFNGSESNCAAVVTCVGKRRGGTVGASVASVSTIRRPYCFISPNLVIDGGRGRLSNPGGFNPNGPTTSIGFVRG